MKTDIGKNASDDEPAIYVMTSDKEKAIQTGLGMSQMPDDTVIHFFCSLHEKWNVRDHVCGEGGTRILYSFYLCRHH